MTQEDRILDELREIRSDISGIKSDICDIKISQAKTETKFDGHIDSHERRKSDSSERWKVGGIIAAIVFGASSLINQFLGGG